MTVAKHLLISGRVQGVFFRANTAQRATGLGLDGWVRNLADGRVEALAQGDRPLVDRLVDWCREGPRWARVDSVEVSSVDIDPNLEGRGFEVRI